MGNGMAKMCIRDRLYIFGLSLTGKIRASGVLLLVRFLELICLIVYVV